MRALLRSERLDVVIEARNEYLPGVTVDAARGPVTPVVTPPRGGWQMRNVLVGRVEGGRSRAAHSVPVGAAYAARSSSWTLPLTPPVTPDLTAPGSPPAPGPL